jgi:ribosome-associated protein YbcJ (S4-like RNA binding protein)
MALNPAFKLAIGVYIVCAVLSFLNAAGAINTGGAAGIALNTSEDKYTSMLDPSTLTEGDRIEVQQEQYQLASFDLKEFIFGAVYIKGTVDEMTNYNPIVGLFTAMIQAAIYIITLWGFVSWIMNRSS